MKQDKKTWRLQKGNRVIFVDGHQSKKGTILGSRPDYRFLIRPDDGFPDVIIAAQFVKHEDPEKRSNDLDILA